MIQLTDAERVSLRARAKRRPDLIAGLREKTDHFLREEIIAPETGVANWKLYYYCPDCSVMLTFDRRLPHEHRCPVCGRAWTGEPYDSSWWGMVNEMNRQAARDLSWLYILTGDTACVRKAADILLAYARRFPSYEAHGNIPYNGPGRIGAQTIDDATFTRTLTCAYDRISEAMGAEEKSLVRDQLFLPSAAFLMAHRHDQLHNHEVIISSAIATVGILFDRADLVDFALYSPYGIAYQLEHGVRADGMWFEDCFSYHFYALESFFEYEKFTLHTHYSLLNHPAYARMLGIAWDELQPDGGFPLIGDAKLDHFNESITCAYEFFWREKRDKKALAMLRKLYQKHPRNSLSAFLYGDETLPDAPPLPQGNCLPAIGKSGHTVLRGAEGSYLFLRSDCYGGEHDHYDRLGLFWQRRGEIILPDLGTTGYGAKLHNAYYKNTATHNTVNINGVNQPPADAVLTWTEKRNGVLCLEAVCEWKGDFIMPDSLVIRQWDEEAYRGVKMIRRIAWSGDWWAELFLVEGAAPEASIDWVIHPRARWDGVCDARGRAVKVPSGATQIPEHSPYACLSDFHPLPQPADLIYCYQGEKQELRVFSRAFGGNAILASGPDNPSHRQISYLIERASGPRAVFAHVFDCGGSIRHVDFSWNGQRMLYSMVDAQGKKREIEL